MSRGHRSKMPFTLPEGKRVIGIDQSLTSTGLALLVRDTLTTSVIIPPRPISDCSGGGACRIAYIQERLLAVLRQYPPEVLCIEGYAFGASASRAHSLGELGGMIRLLIYQQRVTVHAYVVPPTVLKKFATGKGNAEKATVSKGLFKRFGVDVDDNNEADAAGLALIGAALHFPDTLILEKAVRDAMLKTVEALPIHIPGN